MTLINESNTTLRQPWLNLARTAWLVFFAVAALTLLVAIPARWAELTQPTPRTLGYFDAIGLQVLPYAVASFSIEVVFAAVYLILALVIFARRSRDRMALFTALMLVAFGVGNQTITLTVAALRPTPWGQFAFAFFGYAAWVTFTQFPFLFPSGRYVPAWSRIPALIWFLLCIPWNFMPDSLLYPPNWHPAVFIPLFIFLWIAFIYSQVYRYRRVSNSIERQQTKWVIYALAMIVAILITLFILSFAFDSNLFAFQSFEDVPTPTPQIFALWLVSQFANPLAFLLLPIAFAFSILRYRLWDIDIIIRRTLIYGVLTVMLALAYLGSVVLLQQLSRGITGAVQSEIVTIISTLAIAALFNPLRHRVQNAIDHRFYRRKYDATQVLAEFSAAARDEVELEKLTARLLDVVDETMQPTNVSLWLKATERSRGTEGERHV